MFSVDESGMKIVNDNGSMKFNNNGSITYEGDNFDLAIRTNYYNSNINKKNNEEKKVDFPKTEILENPQNKKNFIYNFLYRHLSFIRSGIVRRLTAARL
jgi:hypothetical protein